MRHFTHFKSFHSIPPLLLIPLLLALQAASATEITGDLKAEVAALELGMNGYTIGNKLSAEKKEYASSNRLNDAYDGTYKFSDGELFVVVAQKDDTILALYQRQEEANIDQAKKMISGLMGLFGEPTAMAHDKLIYWAYNGGGKISEENYEKSREGAAALTVLATVKFSSAYSITDEKSEGQQKGTIYFIVSSDRLSNKFMKNE